LFQECAFSFGATKYSCLYIIYELSYGVWILPLLTLLIISIEKAPVPTVNSNLQLIIIWLR